MARQEVWVITGASGGIGSALVHEVNCSQCYNAVPTEADVRNIVSEMCCDLCVHRARADIAKFGHGGHRWRKTTGRGWFIAAIAVIVQGPLNPPTVRRHGPAQRTGGKPRLPVRVCRLCHQFQRDVQLTCI